MQLVDFVDWVEEEMERRGFSRADLAREGDLTTAQVTRVLNRQQNAGDVFLAGIAKAFKIGLDSVYRAAGKIPAERIKSPALRSIELQLAEIEDEGELEMIGDIIRSVRRNRKRVEEAQKRNERTASQSHPKTLL